jgi:hypothetical protein
MCGRAAVRRRIGAVDRDVYSFAAGLSSIVPNVELAMEFIRCWLLHRSTWTILIPGILPAHLDAVAYCPTCDAGRGHRQVQLVPFTTRH